MKKRTFLTLIMLLLIALIIVIFSILIRSNKPEDSVDNTFKENEGTVLFFAFKAGIPKGKQVKKRV